MATEGRIRPSAGPFYLVWLNPKASRISPEQMAIPDCPHQCRNAGGTPLPQLAPAAELPANHPARSGFELFQKHCFACHTLNGAGEASAGPGLEPAAQPH